LWEFEVMDGNLGYWRDKVAMLEGKLAAERARIRDLKRQIADLAERALELVFEKEQLEAELREVQR
jgi:regulator of replication initiation timing